MQHIFLVLNKHGNDLVETKQAQTTKTKEGNTIWPSNRQIKRKNVYVNEQPVPMRITCV